VENENLQLVEINVESVHGILIRCHFTDLVRAVRHEHPTLLETNCNFRTKIWNIYTVAACGATTRINVDDWPGGLGCNLRQLSSKRQLDTSLNLCV
jgi:hypothetical protein